MRRLRAKRLLVRIILPIIVGGAAWGLWRYLKPDIDRSDCQECTSFVSMAFLGYADEHDGWYPVSPLDEYDALSALCGPEDEGYMSRFFGTYGTSSEQTQFFEEQGRLSPDLCPYRYVQGLSTDDPADLIVLYRKRKTHWRDHIQWVPEARWLVMIPGWVGHFGTDEGWIDTPELRRRLRKTLEYLRTRKRPQWEATVAAHEPFLASLSD